MARPSASSAALTRPWAPVSGLEPGPHWARGTAAASDARAGPRLPVDMTRADAATALKRRLAGRTGEGFVARTPSPCLRGRGPLDGGTDERCHRHANDRHGPAEVQPAVTDQPD